MSGLEQLLWLLKKKANGGLTELYNYMGNKGGAGISPRWDDHWKEHLERNMWDQINSKPQFQQNINGNFWDTPGNLPQQRQMPVTGYRG